MTEVYEIKQVVRNNACYVRGKQFVKINSHTEYSIETFRQGYYSI